MGDTQAQDAVVRNLSIIGEAVKNLSAEFREQHDEVEWAKIAGLRDKLVHDYFSLDWDILWDVVHSKIRTLKEQLAALLASRSFAPWLRQLVASGYSAHLVFLWLPSADFAVDRVAERVRTGGHNVPPETVRRRYAAGLRNLFQLYQPLVSGWVLYDSSGPVPRPVAEGLASHPPTVYDRAVWAAAREQARR